VVVIQHPPGSEDCVFLDTCRVSLSQHAPPSKKNEKENKIKLRKPLPKYLDPFPLQTNSEIALPK
jgi:hypothetical protein